MISKSDIDNLAALCRLGLDDHEKASLEKDLAAILNYVDQLQKANVDFNDQLIDPNLSINVMREDTEPHPAELYTAALLANAPKRRGNYLAVQAIVER